MSVDLGGTTPWLDTTRDVAARIEDLLGGMTLAEKAGQMLQLDARGDLVDAVQGRLAGSLLHATPERIEEAAALTTRTRLRIPLLIAEDCVHGHGFRSGATVLPSQLGMACTWDPELLERAARMVATEVAATGVHWTFSPVLCIARDTRWGRVGETFGEDPYLIGELGAAMIIGYQGDGPGDPDAVLACAKHFAGYSQTVGGRDATETELSRRALRSWFLPPFERAVRAGCRTVMLGYQSIDGVPVTANRWLIDEVLKTEWGFTGILVTDWDNVGRMVWEQRILADDVTAATTAVRAGNDIVMSTPVFSEAAQEAVARGDLAVGQLDDAVRRILRLKFDLGLFDGGRTAPPVAVIGSAPHRALNLEVARRSLVLLRNDGTLPLLPTGAGPQRTIAVLGPNADDPDAQLGDWAGRSGQVDWLPDGHPRATITTVLDGLRRHVPAGWHVTSARGADIGSMTPDPEGPVFADGQPRPPVFEASPPDPALLAEAVRVARAADWAVVVLGDLPALAGEGRSTATLELLGGQQALLEAVVGSGTPVIVVLVQSKPSVLPEAATRAAAIVQAFNPGMEGGRAIAELLLGLVEPSGRLPITVPRHAGQLPVYYNQIRGQHGSRYADLTQDPLFAFGEGLGYGRPVYESLTLREHTVRPDGVVVARVRLGNSGERPVRETVQVYVRDLVTSVTWAERELKAFRQVDIAPGAVVDVELAIPASACTVVDAEGRRRVEPGRFELLAGHSSRDEDLLRTEFDIMA
ncbi:glycoside hydrolase family 3 N-terminal domain-containing protein [Actinophytocola oryzae]|uniref:beta-glucosidase n=1 Tax=Actinophytocola oryzae TaxID=502181 RepID=A0A4R7VJQ9_9PSEU|nr:glycoside hydrolase family 3 N-terminal domain-containing protein [Actinophytocola oryzae]TDV49692.1 beta-glucosidase [Actinophytocola oryzae]